MEIKKVVVLGSGTMGHGIAQICAAAGYDTAMSDISYELLDRGMRQIRKNIEREVAKGKRTQEDADALLSRVTPTLDRKAAIADCDLVIEAVPEVLSLKLDLFEELDEECKPEAILATNTSELSVTAIAAAAKRPQKVLGLHFFNPAPVMKLVEVIRGQDTAEETIKICIEFCEKLGKTTVVCRDSQGFITTRVFMMMLCEAFRVYEEGISTKEDIDTAMKLGFNHPMGPLALADLVGLDVIYHACQGLVESFGDRFRLPQSVVNLVRAGHLGIKTGKGFYTYEKK